MRARELQPRGVSQRSPRASTQPFSEQLKKAVQWDFFYDLYARKAADTFAKPAPSTWPFSSRVALGSAREVLRLSLVYNASGYDSREALALLDGTVEIYMSDMKYGDDNLA